MQCDVCMYVMYVRMYAYHVCMHVCTKRHVSSVMCVLLVCGHVCMQCMYVCAVRIRVYIYIYMFMQCACACLCVCNACITCMYVCMYVCM